MSGSVVHVVARLLGGKVIPHGQAQAGGLVPSFVDMENMSTLKICDVRALRPEWVDHGLTIEGMCRNATCAAYLSRVHCRKGYMVFNIAEDVKCPSLQD